jgi:hypothetical protein
MHHTRFLCGAFLTGLLTVSSFAVEGWSQLRAGMNREETAAVLGREIMASRGRGFEVAISDNQAEVVYLNGQVVAWTAPAGVSTPAAPTQAWQFDQERRPAAPSARRTLEPQAAPGSRVRVLPSYRL